VPNPSARTPADAFATLERRLLARRLAALSVRMRVLVLLLAAYVAAFTYWQVRVPLDGAHRAHGPAGAARLLGTVLTGLLLAAAATAAWRRAALAARPPGPAWLALPLPAARVMRHLDAEARWPAAGAFVPALAAIPAGHHLVPVSWLLGMAAGFALAWWIVTGGAAALASRASLPPAATGPAPAEVLALASAARPSVSRRRPAPAWRRESPWRALARLDGRASARRSGARTRLAFAATAFALGAAAWFAAAPPLTRRALAFAAFAAGAVALGAWAIARAGADPPGALRPLPLSIRDAWLARAVRIAAWLGGAVLANAALATALPPAARAGLVMGWWPAGAAIAVLGLNVALTLAPRATIAENLYYGWLAVALVASWMVPLLGWGVMIGGLVHSVRQLARAARRDVA
jgi:hypothetical protein